MPKPERETHAKERDHRRSMSVVSRVQTARRGKAGETGSSNGRATTDRRQDLIPAADFDNLQPRVSVHLVRHDATVLKESSSRAVIMREADGLCGLLTSYLTRLSDGEPRTDQAHPQGHS